MKPYNSSRRVPFLRYLLIATVLIFLVASAGVVGVMLSQPTQLDSEASSANVIPSADQRKTVPSGAVLLTNGVGLTNKQTVSDGNFQVEGYCPIQGGGTVSRTDTDWSCGSYKLQVSDYDKICRLTYTNSPQAFVIFTGKTSTAAYNWRCYAFTETANDGSDDSLDNGDKGTGNACGQPCSATLGLCQNGSTCRYITGSACTSKGDSEANTYCIPTNANGAAPAGWSTNKCVGRDQGNSYVTNPSGQNPTIAEIRQACANRNSTPSPSPTASPTFRPTPSPSASPTGCGSLPADVNKDCKVTIDDWVLFLQSYRTEISKQQL